MPGAAEGKMHFSIMLLWLWRSCCGDGDVAVVKAVNREVILSRRYRDRDLAKFESSRRYRER
jgi:hypothetical protein